MKMQDRVNNNSFFLVILRQQQEEEIQVLEVQQSKTYLNKLLKL